MEFLPASAEPNYSWSNKSLLPQSRSPLSLPLFLSLSLSLSFSHTLSVSLCYSLCLLLTHIHFHFLLPSPHLPALSHFPVSLSSSTPLSSSLPLPFLVSFPLSPVSPTLSRLSLLSQRMPSVSLRAASEDQGSGRIAKRYPLTESRRAPDA